MQKSFAPAAMVLALSAPALAGPMPMDRPIQMNGMDTVCTGIGEAKDDPRWKSYPIRIEFSNGGAQYLAGATLSVSMDHTMIAEMDCPGAWVLLKGTPGSYRVTASIDGAQGKPVHARFKMGSGAQKRIVLRFPDFQLNN